MPIVFVVSSCIFFLTLFNFYRVSLKLKLFIFVLTSILSYGYLVGSITLNDFSFNIFHLIFSLLGIIYLFFHLHDKFTTLLFSILISLILVLFKSNFFSTLLITFSSYLVLYFLKRKFNYLDMLFFTSITISVLYCFDAFEEYNDYGFVYFDFNYILELLLVYFLICYIFELLSFFCRRFVYAKKGSHNFNNCCFNMYAVKL